MTTDSVAGSYVVTLDSDGDDPSPASLQVAQGSGASVVWTCDEDCNMTVTGPFYTSGEYEFINRDVTLSNVRLQEFRTWGRPLAGVTV